MIKWRYNFCVQEKATKYGAEIRAELCDHCSAGLGGTVQQEKRILVNKVREEGFSSMPSQGLTTFRPNCKDTKVVFISIKYFDIDGVEHTIAENLSHVQSHKVIVTPDGSIVDAEKLEADQWLDKTGKNYKAPPCQACVASQSLCTECLVDSRIEKIQTSIAAVSSCRVARTLVSVLESLESMEKKVNDKKAEKEQQISQIMSEVRELAKHYWTLEAKTKRSVREIQSYGKNLKEAAEDFLEDGILNDFWKELTEMDGVKEALEKAYEEHEIIQGQVKIIGERSMRKAESYRAKAEKAKEYLDDDFEPGATVLATPVVGQVGGVLWGASAAGGAFAAEFDSLPRKVVAGAVGGAVGGAASIVLLPAAPYYWYKGITSLINDKAYGGPLKQFQNIAAQMGLVDKHLHQITGALGDIETRLGEATKAEKKVISYDGEKKERMIRRITERAEKLIEACDNYFSLIKSETITEIE